MVFIGFTLYFFLFVGYTRDTKRQESARLVLNLSTAQLCLLRSLLNTDWEQCLEIYLTTRSGITTEEWQALLDAKYVVKINNSYKLSPEGKKAYNVGKIGRWF